MGFQMIGVGGRQALVPEMLQPGTVLLLRHELARDADNAALARRFHATLAPDERQRAARFRLPDQAQDYIVAHGLLRELLAALLGQVRPAGVRLLEAPGGKPLLDPARHLAGPVFSLTHCPGLMLLAVACAPLNLGVDAENLAQADVANGLAPHILAPAELTQWLAAMPGPAALKLALQFWTRKEACLKAQGIGLTHDLQALDTSGPMITVPGAPAPFFRHDLALGDTHVGTVCLDAAPSRLQWLAWHD